MMSVNNDALPRIDYAPWDRAFGIITDLIRNALIVFWKCKL